MRVRTLTKITFVGLAGFGAYTLWSRFGSRLRGGGGTVDHRISARAELTVEEAAVGSDDPVAQAKAILAESDDRSELTRDTPGIERRRSEDTVEP